MWSIVSLNSSYVSMLYDNPYPYSFSNMRFRSSPGYAWLSIEKNPSSIPNSYSSSSMAWSINSYGRSVCSSSLVIVFCFSNHWCHMCGGLDMASVSIYFSSF